MRRRLGIIASSVANKGFKASLGTQVATASGTTLAITTTAPIAVNDLVVVRVAADNLSATTPTFTCADSGANTYTTHRQGAVNATAAAGVAGAIMCSKATTAIATGGTITVTLSGAVAARAAYAQSFVGFNNTLRVAAVGSSGTTAAQTSTASATVTAGDLVLGFSATETRGSVIGDSDNAGGPWSAMVTLPNATTGTDATCVTVAGQHKVSSVSTIHSYDPAGPTTEWVCGMLAMQAGP